MRKIDSKSLGGIKARTSLVAIGLFLIGTVVGSLATEIIRRNTTQDWPSSPLDNCATKMLSACQGQQNKQSQPILNNQAPAPSFPDCCENPMASACKNVDISCIQR